MSGFFGTEDFFGLVLDIRGGFSNDRQQARSQDFFGGARGGGNFYAPNFWGQK